MEDPSTPFVVKVYQNHLVGKDEVVATLTDTIGGVLGRLKDGGTSYSASRSVVADAIAANKVLEEHVRNDASDGSELSGMTIKFALATDSREGVNAAKLQVTDAVTNATEGVSALGPTPRVVDTASSAVDTITNVVTEIQTFGNTWGVLLKRMELFNRIVADIAQVFHNPSLDSLFLNAG